MGDHGFKGAGEFGGQDGNFNCLPDYHWTKCSHRKQGLFGDDFTDKRYACDLTSRQDADGKGFGYDECTCVDDDYRNCPIFRGAKRVESTCACIDEFKGFLEACNEEDRQEVRREEARRRLKFIEEGFRGG
jgi:hypothetical protein